MRALLLLSPPPPPAWTPQVPVLCAAHGECWLAGWWGWPLALWGGDEAKSIRVCLRSCSHGRIPVHRRPLPA